MKPKPSIALLAAFFLMFPALVFAAEGPAAPLLPAVSPAKLTCEGKTNCLTIGQVLQINIGLSHLDCAPKTVKDGARESVICDPFDWPPGLSWQISGAAHKCEDVVKRYFNWRNQVIAKLPRTPEGKIADDIEAKFAMTDGDYKDLDSGLTLAHFKKSDLEGKKIAPSVLQNLWAIIDD